MIPEFIKELWKFIVENFKRMPKWVRVIVYLVTFAVVMLVVVRYSLPELFESSYAEIHGEILGPDGEYLPLSALLIEFHSDNLYVKKNQEADLVRFDWIVKLDKKKLNESVKFKVREYNQRTSDGVTRQLAHRFSHDFDSHELLRRSERGIVKLEFDIDRRHLAPREEAGENVKRMSFAIPLPSFLWAAASTPQQALKKQVYDTLVRGYTRSANPAAQMEIRETLSGSDVNTMVSLAESLVVAVNQRRKDDIVSFATALSDFPSLAPLSSSGSHKQVLAGNFFRKAADLLEGEYFVGQSVSWFLQKAQDARSLDPVFALYDRTTNERAKQLCLYVLEAFASNADVRVKDRVKTWLQNHESEPSPKLKGVIGKSKKKF